MSIITGLMLTFSLLGALDRIFGNRFHLGKEFERGFLLMGNMALSMIGMIVLAPLIAHMIQPAVGVLYKYIKIDPSIIPSILFANDMGGAPLSRELAIDAEIGMFNGMIVSSMMGATICFSIPVSTGMVSKEKQNDLLFGLLSGIVTVPVGCFFAGLLLRIPIKSLLNDLLPLFIFGLIIAVLLFFFPNISVKIFKGVSVFMKALITVGLALAIFTFLTGKTLFTPVDTMENAMKTILNACVVMSGAFPLIYLISKLLSPLSKKLASKLGISEVSASGFIGTLATHLSTYDLMSKMESKGIVLNAAFTVSAACTLAAHLAYTLAYNSSYLFPMLVGKVISGVSAVVLANFLYKKVYSHKKSKSK